MATLSRVNLNWASDIIAVMQKAGRDFNSPDIMLGEIGVRLVPSVAAEAGVGGYRGTRHTSARRYSFDDPKATVIVVSEDGPVTVVRGGRILGASAPATADD